MSRGIIKTMRKKKNQSEGKGLKTRSISIRMTVAEMEKVDQFAAEFNLPTGMYMRLCALLGYMPYSTTRSGPTVPGAVKVERVTEISSKPITSSEPRHGRSPRG